MDLCYVGKIKVIDGGKISRLHFNPITYEAAAFLERYKK